MAENEIYEIKPPVPPTLMERFRENPKLYGAWAIALLFLFLVVVMIITNLALYGQNQELIAALRERMPEPGEQVVVIQTNEVTEARQQATVNEQHLYLLDEIQAQQLKLIESLTNRVNRSAQVIRALESQQFVLEDQTRQLASLNGNPNAELDAAKPFDAAGSSDATANPDEGEGFENEAEGVEAVLASTFQGVQIDELFSVDNPAFSGIVVWDYDTQSGVMQLSNLPTLPPEFRYQLWVLDPNYENFVAGGTFDISDGAPQFEYTFRPGEEVREAIGYAVTAESAVGSGVPSGPTVVSTRNLVGKL